jgi:hypothetical protein
VSLRGVQADDLKGLPAQWVSDATKLLLSPTPWTAVFCRGSLDAASGWQCYDGSACHVHSLRCCTYVRTYYVRSTSCTAQWPHDLPRLGHGLWDRTSDRQVNHLQVTSWGAAVLFSSLNLSHHCCLDGDGGRGCPAPTSWPRPLARRQGALPGATRRCTLAAACATLNPAQRAMR